METVKTKSVDAEIVDLDVGRREAISVVSTDALDRDGEVVVPAGLAKKNYQGLPVLFDHRHDKPIGTSLWVKSQGGRVLAKTRFSDTTQLSRDMFALAQDGVLRSWSVGFLPLEVSPPRPEEKGYSGASKVYRRWEAVEYSLVPVPSNPEAISLAVAKGLVSQESGLLLVAKAGGYTVHEAGVAHARELIASGRIDKAGAWNPDDKSPGAGGDWKEFSLGFIGEDKSAAPDTVAHWHFPVVAGGKVSLHGLRAAISRAGQNGDAAVETAARALLAEAEKRAKSFLVVVALGAARMLGERS